MTRCIIAIAIGVITSLVVFILAIVGSIGELMVYPWLVDVRWSWPIIFSRHCLSVAWVNGILWPHVVVAVLSGCVAGVMRWNWR